ncbi:hypothetical protein ACFFX0_16510 [Citricoccus parietis]|uniref:Uncharacterized protein n=1 Tax=Citricoccus parietis TaxID=592307 RepID=A0ABV5G197_9MICC
MGGGHGLWCSSSTRPSTSTGFRDRVQLGERRSEDTPKVSNRVYPPPEVFTDMV